MKHLKLLSFLTLVGMGLSVQFTMGMESNHLLFTCSWLANLEDYCYQNPGKIIAGLAGMGLYAAAVYNYGFAHGTAITGALGILGILPYRGGSKWLFLRRLENEYLCPEETSFCIKKIGDERVYEGADEDYVPIYLWKPHFSGSGDPSEKDLGGMLKDLKRFKDLDENVIKNALAYIQKLREKLATQFNFDGMFADIKIVVAATHGGQVANKALDTFHAWEWVRDWKAFEQKIQNQITEKHPSSIIFRPFEQRARLLHCKLYLAEQYLLFLQSLKKYS